MVDDGSSLAYFQAHGFSVVELVVPDTGTYQAELNTIKALGMQPVIDVEMPIWDGGQLASTPISHFAGYFQSLKNAGWQYVASEGGRTGDLAYMQQYFKGYVNYNCDQCGLWDGTVHKPIHGPEQLGELLPRLSGPPSKLDQKRPLLLASRTASWQAYGLTAEAITRFSPTPKAAARPVTSQC